MSKKLEMRHGVFENVEKRSQSNLVNMVFQDANSEENVDSRVLYEDISIDRITPRSINRYKQNRIDRLAKSIRNTNNRLIHPIVVVKASDLPEDHEVIQKFKERGVDISSLDYILVAGERRYRAWQKLREEEAKKIGNQLGVTNPFDYITANVLTKKEAKNEQAFFEDSNLESRQLTPMEGILHIQDALSEVDTPQKKREALIEMNGGSNQGISDDPYVAEKKFNTANYCEYYLAAELGIEGWSKSTIRAYLSVVNNCCIEVIDAVIDGKYSAGAARTITAFSDDEQKELLNLWVSGQVEIYKEKLQELTDKYKNPIKIVRYTHKDAKREIKSTVKKISVEKKNLKIIYDNLGGMDKELAGKALKKIEKFSAEMTDILNAFS